MSGTRNIMKPDSHSVGSCRGAQFLCVPPYTPRLGGMGLKEGHETAPVSSWIPAFAGMTEEVFVLHMPCIGACRGAQPLGVCLIPQEWGTKGVDEAPNHSFPRYEGGMK